MPNYKSDLRWLAEEYPAEYAKIPAGLVDNQLYNQLHGEDYPTEDGSGPGRWIIMFVAVSDEVPEAEDVIQVVLDIPRPDSEDEAVGPCADHTLRVSRKYCPQHLCRPCIQSQLD